MRVLIACEMSGVVRRAFRKLGHEAWSCDIVPPIDDSRFHFLGDVREYLWEEWDMMIAFPPCTHLAVSGARWWPQKQTEQTEALEFVRTLMGAPIKRIAIENPVGKISSAIRKPDQIVQPWWFGEHYIKSTCLWLKNLPLLKPTNEVWAYESYAHTAERDPVMRSITFDGLAEAMAEQWG